MPISHKYNCIFIHIPKNGGTSIEETLEMNHADHNVENRDIMHGWIHSEDLKAYGFASPALQHLSAKDLKRILPDEIFNHYFKFAVVRNPWDRMLSQYLFDRLFTQSTGEGETGKDFSLDEFHEYIEALPPFLMQEQCEFITDDKGELLVDFVGRFENLENDFQTICKRIGIGERYLPCINASKHTHYSAYYTEESRKVVHEIFTRDIETFAYQFEERNWTDNMIHILGRRIRHKLSKRRML